MSHAPRTPTPADQFWAWSNTFYEQKEVQACCLSLQDRFGVNINLVLFCLWSAQHRKDALTHAFVQAAVLQAKTWDANIGALLRQARSALKSAPGVAEMDDFAKIYDQAKALELEAERLHQSSFFTESESENFKTNTLETLDLEIARENLRVLRFCLDLEDNKEITVICDNLIYYLTS